MDSFLINDFLYDFDFPKEFSSDVARVSYFARKNNISIQELDDELQKFIKTFKDQENDQWKLDIFKDTTKKILHRQNFLVGNNNPNILDTKLSGGSYGALMKKDKDGNWIIQIVRKVKDDAVGSHTGLPGAEFWEGTPGSYYASSILGVDDFNYSSKSDKLCIDGGSGWCVFGMNELRQELEEKYGDELREEVKKRKQNLQNLQNNIARKVHENLSKWMSY